MSGRATCVALLIVCGAVFFLSDVGTKKQAEEQALRARTDEELEALRSERLRQLHDEGVRMADVERRKQAEKKPVDEVAAAKDITSDPGAALTDRKAGPFREKYLLVPAVQHSFPVALQKVIMPMIALAGHTGRTAVLPRATWGYPAFRSTVHDPKYLNLSYFIDVRNMMASLPCAKTMAYDDWKARESSVVSALVQLGLPVELGSASKPGSAVPNPRLPKLGYNCIDSVAGTKKEPRKLRAAYPFYAGPAGHAAELLYVHATDGVNIRRRMCLSFHSALNATRSFNMLDGDKSVMLFNVPGSHTGAFQLGNTGYLKGQVRLFQDIAGQNICGQGARPGLSGFDRWPLMARHWVKWAKDRTRVFTKDQGKFTCVRIQFEQLVEEARNNGNVGTIAKVRDNESRFLTKCLATLSELVQADKVGPVLFTTDIHTVARRGKADLKFEGIGRFALQAMKTLRSTFPGHMEFCGTKRVTEAKEDEAHPVVSYVLKAQEGNCAFAEAALCREAPRRFLFGAGREGKFVLGQPPHENQVKWYRTCQDVLDGRLSKIRDVATLPPSAATDPPKRRTPPPKTDAPPATPQPPEPTAQPRVRPTLAPTPPPQAGGGAAPSPLLAEKKPWVAQRPQLKQQTGKTPATGESTAAKTNAARKPGAPAATAEKANAPKQKAEATKPATTTAEQPNRRKWETASVEKSNTKGDATAAKPNARKAAPTAEKTDTAVASSEKANAVKRKAAATATATKPKSDSVVTAEKDNTKTEGTLAKPNVRKAQTTATAEKADVQKRKAEATKATPKTATSTTTAEKPNGRKWETSSEKANTKGDATAAKPNARKAAPTAEKTDTAVASSEKANAVKRKAAATATVTKPKSDSVVTAEKTDATKAKAGNAKETTVAKPNARKAEAPATAEKADQKSAAAASKPTAAKKAAESTKTAEKPNTDATAAKPNARKASTATAEKTDASEKANAVKRKA
eukprot:Rhum_TRINITY_DN13752_c0_g3::Rhum_TRINITY_DN13752_c0_g3_i1::g.63687::m.63687